MPPASRESDTYRRLDARVAELAVRQHGVAALSQLLPLGIGARAVQRRADASRLFRVHRGVYALVPASLLSREGRWMAAVLASGRGAALLLSALAARSAY